MNINERNWNILLDAIDKERVVPIIGDEFYYIKDENSGQEISVKKYLIRELSKKFGVTEENADFASIADTIEVENFKNRRNAGGITDLYFEIDAILRSARIRCRTNIEDFLSIGKFPLILTTSYIAGLEPALTANFGDLKVGVYDKTNRNDLDEEHLSSSIPSLYYLFGKGSRLNKSYMVTEDDFLDFLHAWHNLETRPKAITKHLNGKFLLLLGCDYPNWLFRFFWHSIKNFSLTPSTNGMQGVVTRNSAVEDAELVRFLSRIQTGIFENSKAFIKEFMEKWGKRQEAGGIIIGDPPEEGNDDVDVFISYADEDLQQVKNIASKLTNLGAKVWFDKAALTSSDHFDDIIEEEISRAKRFMPIISKTTLIPARRYFRREWTLAIKEEEYRYGMSYFAPVVIDDSDINSEQVPKPFRDAHTINSNSEDFESQLKKLIRSIRS